MFPDSLIHRVVPVSPQDSLQDVSDRFAHDGNTAHLLSLPVVENGKPVGVITRHILDKLMLSRFGRELHGRKCMRDVMKPDPILVDVAEDIESATSHIIGGILSPITEDYVVVEQGRYVGVGFILDILCALQERLRQRSVQLDMASKAKSQFLANMSHEIRTPMNGIVGMLEMMRDAQSLSLRRHHFDTMEACVNQLMAVVNDILDFSKIEAGKLSLERIAFAPMELAEDCVNMVYTSCRNKSLKLTCFVDASVPDALLGDPLRIKQVLVNLLNNAIKFTETGVIALRLFHGTASALRGHYSLRIEIEDTGIGIPVDVQQHLFTEFSQADGSITRKHGGTGLGLAICKRLTDLMEGSIGVESTWQQGSVFWVELSLPMATTDTHLLDAMDARTRVVLDIENTVVLKPVAQQLLSWGMMVSENRRLLECLASDREVSTLQTTVLTDRSPSGFSSGQLQKLPRTVRVIFLQDTLAGQELVCSDQQARVEVLPYPVTPVKLRALFHRTVECNLQGNAVACLPAQPIRVLVAEDNAVNQKVIAAYLNKLGAQSVIVPDGQAAVDAYRQDDGFFDLILMDIEMPVMDGWTAARAIRRLATESGDAALVIVALSAHALSVNQDKIQQCGMNAYLAKPIKLATLLAVLKQLNVTSRCKKISD